MKKTLSFSDVKVLVDKMFHEAVRLVAIEIHDLLEIGGHNASAEVNQRLETFGGTLPSAGAWISMEDDDITNEIIANLQDLSSKSQLEYWKQLQSINFGFSFKPGHSILTKEVNGRILDALVRLHGS